MYITLPSHVLLIYCLLLDVVTADNCPYTECECYGTHIDCADRSLTAMPVHLGVNDSSYITMSLDSNYITEISAGLPSRLTEISMNENSITTIDDDAFDQLSSTLETLYFMNARFERIPDAFLHLNALTDLNIVDTKIIDWNIGAMAHIGQTLETLYLYNVGLTTWPAWVKFFSNLNELNLESNSITFIPDNAFDSMTNSLNILTLANNMLTSTPESFSKLANLITLNVQGNRISNLTWLPASSHLSGLSLNNNSIWDANQLSNALSVYANTLESVDLSYNKLRAIPDIPYLTEVEMLDFNNNQISDPNSGSVPSDIPSIDFGFNLLPAIPTIYMNLHQLSFLSLHHNVIRELRAETFPHWVSDADLSYNLITDLTDTSFPINCSLIGLLLSNNPLFTISNHAFDNLRSLSSLTMQVTKLTRLPLSIANLPSLSYLDMTDSSKLVCTCLEKSLTSKLTSGVHVIGYCGEISIYNFFATFGLMCP